MAADPNVPVAPDLRQLAEEFVTYAVGDAESFPHYDSVTLSIGGQTVVSIDNIAAALSNRDIWKTCPADWEGYAAGTCPVDILGPLRWPTVNNEVLVYSGEYAEVTCAPTMLGPLPEGRRVVLQPSEEMRTCASDFALLLVADDQGRLRSVDLTLSNP